MTVDSNPANTHTHRPILCTYAFAQNETKNETVKKASNVKNKIATSHIEIIRSTHTQTTGYGVHLNIQCLTFFATHRIFNDTPNLRLRKCVCCVSLFLLSLASIPLVEMVVSFLLVLPVRFRWFLITFYVESKEESFSVLKRETHTSKTPNCRNRRFLHTPHTNEHIQLQWDVFIVDNGAESRNGEGKMLESIGKFDIAKEHKCSMNSYAIAISTFNGNRCVCRPCNGCTYAIWLRKPTPMYRCSKHASFATCRLQSWRNTNTIKATFRCSCVAVFFALYILGASCPNTTIASEILEHFHWDSQKPSHANSRLCNRIARIHHEVGLFFSL